MIAVAATHSSRITRVRAGSGVLAEDALAVEEPLEIRVVAGGIEHIVTVTMRTPGSDAELALGFLIAERIIDRAAQATAYRRCGDRNVLKVELEPGLMPRLSNIARNFMSSASCGLCGKSSIDAVMANVPAESVRKLGRPVDAAILQSIPDTIRAAQTAFDATGGVHAVAAFTFDGQLMLLREDVGRHNALDKVVGAALLEGAPDLSDRIVALSGRAGFELIQKAAVARAPIVVAIGAPSDLAVEIAHRTGVTLVGFLRASGFNIYTHPERVALRGDASDVA